MNRPKWTAIVTGAIALLLSFAYLLLVQLLDFRGEMVPAPIDLSSLLIFSEPGVNFSSNFSGTWT